MSGSNESPSGRGAGSSGILGPATLISLLSLIGTMLACLGYGSALAIEAEFGIPHSTVFEDVLDLIVLSTWPIANLLAAMSELLRVGNVLAMLASNIMSVMLIALLCFGLIFLVIAVYRKYGWPKTALSFLVRRPDPGADSLASLAGRGAIYSVAIGLLWCLANLAVIGLTLAVIVVMSIVPMLGMTGTQIHIRKYVIEPRACAHLRSRETRQEDMRRAEKRAERGEKQTDKTEKGAVRTVCVAVAGGDQQEVARGRLVLSTREWVILFDPDSGGAERIPVSGCSGLISPDTSIGGSFTD